MKVRALRTWAVRVLLANVHIGAYQEGDFVANFHGCAKDSTRDCEAEMGPLMSRWREMRDHERR